MTNLDNYKPLMQERAELADLMKKCEARIKELDADLRPVLEGRGEIISDGYSFNVKLVAGRTTLDKPALDEFLQTHGMTVNEFERQGAPYTTFTIKKVNMA